MTIEPTLVTTNFAYQKWINVGYEQFALEGMDGIQVERLARILKLNKSGFYYYFGDREFYLDQLLKFHLKLVEKIGMDMRKMKQFDPDFFNVMINHELTVMVQMQLLRYRHHPGCYANYGYANAIADKEIIPAWSAFMGIASDPELAHQLFGHTRDIIYSRITPRNLNHDLIKSLIYEVKEVAQRLLEKSNPHHVLS